jgi:hypothetical protein
MLVVSFMSKAYDEQLRGDMLCPLSLHWILGWSLKDMD